MQFGDLSIEDLVKLAVAAFGATAATHVIYTSGYFSIIGPEFLGIYFDGNLISGIIQILPSVTGYLSLSFVLYYWIYKFFNSFNNADSIIDFLIMMDKVMVIPVLASLFMDGSWLELRSSILMMCAFFIAGVVFFQNLHYGSVNYVSVAFLIFTLFNGIDYAGKASAYNDLIKDSPRYSLYTDERNYVNVTLLKSTTNGIIVKSGNDIIFYKSDQIDKIERNLTSIKQFNVE